jgi:cysteine synthase A
VIEAGLIDEVQPVPGSLALQSARELARKEGILCGISGGATFAAALEVARAAPKGATILAMLPDTGERYLSTPLFAEIVDEMDDDERAIAASTPRYRFDTATAAPAPAPAEPTERAVAHVDAIVADPDQPLFVFALEWCEFSWSVRNLLSAAGIDFRSVDLDGLDYRENDWGGDVRRALARLTGAATIPQVFVGGRHIGGATETMQTFNDRRLHALLEASGSEASIRDIGDAFRFLPGWLHPRGKPAGRIDAGEQVPTQPSSAPSKALLLQTASGRVEQAPAS